MLPWSENNNHETTNFILNELLHTWTYNYLKYNIFGHFMANFVFFLIKNCNKWNKYWSGMFNIYVYNTLLLNFYRPERPLENYNSKISF